MFGRRRHVAPVVTAPMPAPAPRLSEDQIFELVHTQIAAAIGERGEWALTRRADSDTDALFHGVIAHSVATHVVAALTRAQAELADAASPAASTVAGAEHAAADAEANIEPAAFGWQPAPITVWTDLKKPVTGEIARIREDQLVA